MNRRESLKTIVAVSGALAALPAWAADWKLDELPSLSSSFSHQEQTMLASVVDTIIPPGNSIGALSVGVDQFLQKLIDHCYEKPVGDNVKLQLSALDSASVKAWGKAFPACDQSQRQELLLSFSTATDKQQQEFFNLMKSETIRGFNTSREVMVNFHKFKQVPGHFHGCVDVNDLTDGKP